MKHSKEEYKRPKIQVITFSSKDIITDSIPLPDDTLEP